MAKVKQGMGLHLSGKLGALLVFKTVGNQTIVCAAPTKRKVWSDKQKQRQEQFKAASVFATQQITNPTVKEAYARTVMHHPTKTAYHAALADYLNPPNIYSLQYHSGLVSVCATDDFRVCKVVIQVIVNHNVIYEANATQQANGIEWVLLIDFKVESQCIIKAIAYDVPGHTASIELTV